MSIFRKLGLESTVIPEEGLPVQTPTPEQTPEPTQAPAPVPTVTGNVDGGDSGVNLESDAESMQLEAEAETMEGEGNDIGLAGADISKALITLENISTILAKAPDEEINETTAAIVDAAIQDINSRFDIENAKEISIEFFQVQGAKQYRHSANEAINERLEQLKKAAYAVVEKIIGWIKQFWSWLTATHKSTKKKLEAAIAAAKNINVDATVTLPKYQADRLASGDLVASAVINNGRTLEAVCHSSTLFIKNAFPKVIGQDIAFVLRDEGVRLAKICFGNFKSAGDAYVLYSGIAGRHVEVDFSGDDPRSAFKVNVSKVSSERGSNELALKEHDIDVLCQQASSTLAASTLGYNECMSMIRKLEAWRGSVGAAVGGLVSQRIALLNNYSAAVSTLSSVGYAEALRYADAVVGVLNAYTKAAKPGNDLNPNTNTPLLN